MGFYEFKYEQSGNALKLTNEYLRGKSIILIEKYEPYDVNIIKITEKSILFSFPNKTQKWIAKMLLDIKEEENKIILINNYAK